MINGMSANNDIDPSGNLALESPGAMPGKSSGQGYFLDANMLGKITVYDANIPASLGGFTGGVVDAEPLSYSGVNSTSVRYRTTGSSWASMKVDDSYDRDNKTMPDRYTSQFQPDYDKSFYSLITQQGLTDNLGVVLGVSRRDSDIKQNRIVNKEGDIDSRQQKRRSDNVMANFTWQASS